jgi:hypothetical protein
MVVIHVKTCGDLWIQPDEFWAQLQSINAPDQIVCFDTGAEGTSLESSGILSAIDQWVNQTQHNRDCVVINSPNTFEKTSYRNLYSSEANHFFPMSFHYQKLVQPVSPDAKKFGLFFGRHTEERNIIALDCWSQFRPNFLFSIMRTRYIVNPWDPELQQIKSLDNTSVQDQYLGEKNTNSSLLDFYHLFEIELVAETCCRGETFFPTEKTVRPMLAQKPVLIFGPRFFLQNLKKLGFKTYSDCWSEDYDQLEGYERWSAIQEIIKQIISQGYDTQRAQQIAQHNADHVRQWHQYAIRDNPKELFKCPK